MPTTQMTPSELKQYRSIANQALYAAQYIATVHGDPRYEQAITKYFVPTDSGLQPVVIDIRDYVVSGRDSLALQVFDYCKSTYAANSSLINAWLRQSEGK